MFSCALFARAAVSHSEGQEEYVEARFFTRGGA